LSTLLSWLWISWVMEVDNVAEAAGAERVGHRFQISFPMWANGLRLIEDSGVTVHELRHSARAACNLGGLERWGWIALGGIASATVVRPTRAGAYARRVWPRAIGQVESRWRARFGDEAIDALRTALGGPSSSLPWAVPEVAPSNGFVTRLVEDDTEASVVDAGDLPLGALLGRRLTAATVEHETDAVVSLPLGASLLRVMAGDAVPVGDLPQLTGLSKEGVAMATGYLQRSGLAVAAPGRAVRLTPKGIDARNDYESRVARPHDLELRHALDAVLSQRQALSEGLVPPDGCWRGAPPYLAQTKRLIADPTGALPWHPMVLHRGGWPDAC
jgi:hypothetical protein